LDNLSATGLEQVMVNVGAKTIKVLQHGLVKLLTIVNHELGPKFLQQIKSIIQIMLI
jgi:hypothetical protein